MAAKPLIRLLVSTLVVYVVFWIGFQAGRYFEEENTTKLSQLVGKNVFDADHLDPLSRHINNNQDLQTTTEVPVKSSESCRPVKRVVFIKTHKTGSTTAASMIERFGFTRNLSFVVPPDRKYGPHILSSNELFHRNMLRNSPPPLNGGKYYDMLTNHVRYNRPEMEAVVPNATYVTIIRHPVKHFESSFAYFGWKKKVKDKSGDLLSAFLETPQTYIDERVYFWWQSHNGQLFDLGMRTEDTNDDEIVDEKIEILRKDLDLVLIAEYFDESLLLLRKQLCWTMDDILYIPKNIRPQNFRRTITNETSEKILNWNKADYRLYKHFNDTLWKKIHDYGPSFEEDLQEFRNENERVMKECINPVRVVKRDPRESSYELKPNAPPKCVNLWRGDVTFTSLLRNKQLENRIVYPPKS
ncbi:galactosylceramide sulfotransferase-like [Glandiceps talaboti]